MEMVSNYPRKHLCKTTGLKIRMSGKINLNFCYGKQSTVKALTGLKYMVIVGKLFKHITLDIENCISHVVQSVSENLRNENKK